MTKEELTTFLKENLSIQVSEETGYYGDVSVKVLLKLGEETISEDWFYIDRGNPDI